MPRAGTRLHFPRGGTARLWTEPDRRPRRPAGLGGALETLIVGELLARAAADLADGAEVYALYQGSLDAARVTCLNAADLLTGLGPR